MDSAYEPKPKDGLIVQLNWVGHTLKDRDGVDFSRFDPWEFPLAWLMPAALCKRP